MTGAMSYRERDSWVRDLCADAELSAATRLVGVRLAHFLDPKTGLCNSPGNDGFRQFVGLKRRAVINAIAALKAAGWIEGERSRGWHANSFRLVVKSTTETVHGGAPFDGPETVHGGAPMHDRIDATCNAQTVHGHDTNGAPPCTQVEETSKKESKNRSNGSTKSDRFVAKKATEREIAKGFEDWWRAYPRKVEPKGARLAYARVVKKGEATLAELLAGAMAYAAECVGKEARFVKHPTTWLNNGCWADEHGGAPAAKQIAWPECVALFKRRGFWPTGIGPKPGLPGCRAPPDVLALHGYERQED
jgi:hypothetical protein